MISPDDYENSAQADMGRGDTASAMVYAVLALASALNKLADSHYWLADTTTSNLNVTTPGRQSRRSPITAAVSATVQAAPSRCSAR